MTRPKSTYTDVFFPPNLPDSFKVEDVALSPSVHPESPVPPSLLSSSFNAQLRGGLLGEPSSPGEPSCHRRCWGARCAVAQSANMSCMSELREHYVPRCAWEKGMLGHPTTSGDMQRSSDIPKEEPLSQAVSPVPHTCLGPCSPLPSMGFGLTWLPHQQTGVIIGPTSL